MKIQYSKGKVPKQAHVAIPEGLYEEEHGRQGFFGPATVVPNPNRRANPIEQLWFLRLRGRRGGGICHGLDGCHVMTMPSSPERSQLVSI